MSKYKNLYNGSKCQLSGNNKIRRNRDIALTPILKK